MNILVVAGYCLKVNSSANLCHLSYIRGLTDLGHEVDLITVDEKDFLTDDSMKIPESVCVYKYPCSLYEKLSNKKLGKSIESNSDSVKSANHNRTGLKQKAVSMVKNTLRKSYGFYGVDSAWCRHACKFRSDKLYDVVISLAHPPISHVLVEKLKEQRKIKFKHWIQIWEDPWSLDARWENDKLEVIKEEGRLLSIAESICYVSPLTLKYQKERFPEAADKMFWMPLPSYYETLEEVYDYDYNTYGYFGDYYSNARNLSSFYNAALRKSIYVNICGNSDKKFDSTEKIQVYPRLPLDELAKVENKTNVLVFLCNLQGGQIPGKIYQYSATDKMILFILDGTDEEKQILKEYFVKYNRYVFCNNNEESIEKAIEKIEKGNLKDVNNVPLNDFVAPNIVKNILARGNCFE